MVRWAAALSAAVAAMAVATANKEGDAPRGVSVDRDRPGRWRGRALAETEEGTHTAWRSGGGSQGEEDEQSADITLPSGCGVGGSTSGAISAGSTRGNGDSSAAVGTGEEDGRVEDGDAATALNMDAPSGSTPSETRSNSGQHTREDASSEAVDVMDATSAPAGTGFAGDNSVESNLTANTDMDALPSTRPEATGDDEGFLPEEPLDDAASSFASGMEHSTTSPGDTTIIASSDRQSSSGDRSTETPTDTLDDSASSVSASTTDNNTNPHPELTPTPETYSPEVTKPVTDAPTTSQPSASPVVETPTDTSTTDSPAADEPFEDTPAPGIAGVDPVSEPETAAPSTSETETLSGETDSENPTSDVATPAPTTTDAPPIEDSPVREGSDDELARGPGRPTDEPLPQSPAESTEEPVITATPVSEADLLLPVVDSGHDATDPPRTTDTQADPVVADVLPSPHPDTGNEATSSESSGHTHNSDSDPVRSTEAPVTSQVAVSVPMQPVHDEPTTTAEETPSEVAEESPGIVDEEAPAKETPNKDVEEAPGITEAPHAAAVETPSVIVAETPGGGTDGGSKAVDAPVDTSTAANGGDNVEREEAAEKTRGHTKKDDDKKEEGGDTSADNTTAAANSGGSGSTPASDADEASTPTSHSDPDPVELVPTETSSAPLMTTEQASPVDVELSTSLAVAANGASETSTTIAEDETDSNGIPGEVHSSAVETNGEGVDAVVPMTTANGGAVLAIPEISSGSTERAAFGPTNLRLDLRTTSAPVTTLDSGASHLGAGADESNGPLPTGSPASAISVHTIASASIGSNSAIPSTSETAVSSGHTSTSSLVPSSGVSKEVLSTKKAALSESDEPKATVSAGLLTVDTATKLAATSSTETVAELTGSGALILKDGTTAESYVRGQTSIESGLVATDSEEEALLSGASGTANEGQAHIIGGRKSRVGNVSSGLYVSSSMFQNVVRYTACVASVLSVALLVGFHFVYLDGRLRWPTHSPGIYWSPNAWEFVVYTGYLQQTMVLSPMTLMQTPFFLWEFTDIFAWSNLLMYKNPNPAASDGRRLDIIILNSLVGYADRIGADEASLIFRVDAGFAVVLVVVLALAAALYGVDKWRSIVRSSDSTDHKLHASCARRLLGLCVLLWFFSLFPLTLVGSFEVAMEVQASMYSSGPLVLSMVAVVAISAGGLALAARSVLHTSSSDLRQPKTRALWGALYVDHKHSARLFFVFTAALQVVTGLAVGAMRAGKALLVLLLVLHGTYLLALFACAPFTARAALAQRFAYAATAAKLLNVVMAFAFLESVPLSVDARCRVARTFIAMNAFILVAWFLRHLVLFCTCVVVMSSHNDDDADAERPIEDGGRADIVRLECGSSQQIHVSYGRASLGPNGNNGRGTTSSHCKWQSSTTPMKAIL